MKYMEFVSIRSRDKLNAAATNAYQSGDIAKARCTHNHWIRILALERINRRAQKARKLILKHYSNHVYA